MPNGREKLEDRVLILAPVGRDAVMTQAILSRAQVSAVPCADLNEVCAELERGAAALMVAEEAVDPAGGDCLRVWLRDQPPWSDLAVLVLARPGADSTAVAEAMDLLGNVTVLERPMRVAALVSAVRTALRARQRQYQMRAHLAERERAAEELRANDRRKDEFLAVLAHELRNPLAPISNSLEMLRLSDQDPRAKRCSEIIGRQVRHMVRLVDDLLEISRITRGKIELRPEPVEVAAVVRSAVETSRPLIEAANHELILDLPEEDLVLEADPVRLAQVLANLLNNAAHYTEAGGRIWITAARRGDGAVISVRDSGTGIEADMLPRVFEMFAQVDRRMNRTHGGLGIGLTLVKTLVEMHGGTVEALSEGLGRGSEFIVRLPLVAAHPRSVTRSAGAERRDLLAPQRILVVDDNRDSAESLGGLLKVLGADVHVAYNGPDALEVLASYRPSVVIVDIGMPAMDGYEVARRIRQHPDFAHVLLIAMSGWGQKEDRRHSQAAGFDYHLIKPVDLDVLQTLLAAERQHPDTRQASARN